MENRNGLIVNAMVTQADGHAEREAAKAMVADVRQANPEGNITLGADKGYDAAEFIKALQDMKVTPHVAGLPGQGGDPGPYTARGVYLGVQAAAKQALGADNMSGVQFVHRNLAYLVFFGVLFQAFYMWKNHRNGQSPLLAGQQHAIWAVTVLVVLQFVLGIFTLLHKVPLTLGVIHQAGALLLLGSQVYLLHRLTHVSIPEQSTRQ